MTPELTVACVERDYVYQGSEYDCSIDNQSGIGSWGTDTMKIPKSTKQFEIAKFYLHSSVY